MVFIIEQGEMFKSGTNDDVHFSALNYLIVGILAISIPAVLFNKALIPNDKLVKSFTRITIYIYAITILFSLFYELPSRNILGYSLVPLTLFLFMSIIARLEKTMTVIIGAMFIMFLLLAVHFFLNYSLMFLDVEGRSMASYTVMFFLPFMLCSPSRVFRLIAIASTLVVILFSLKLGGFIAITAGLGVYLLIDQVGIKNKKFKIGGWILFIAGAVCIYWVIILVNGVYLDNLLTDRLADAQDSGGSGRIDLYSEVWNLIGKSDLVNILFGHGWGGTMRYTSYHLTAHNDFLEIFFDFGIISLVLYVLLIINLIRLCRKLTNNKSEYAPALGASIAFFICGSLLSHVWIYCNNLLVFAMFWGFVCGNNKRNNRFT